MLRQAVEQREKLTPVFLQAVRERAKTTQCRNIQLQRLAAFGVFFLAQARDHRLLEPLVQLFESVEPDQPDEWLFAGRLCFFGHRLIAAVSPLAAQPSMDLALDSKLRPLTRSLALCAIGLQAAYGDITRAEAVDRLGALFRPVQALRDPMMDACWVRTAAKLHSRKLERELRWFLSSGRLDQHGRMLISHAIQLHPDANFASIMALEPMVDLFTHVFPRDIRDGEPGLLPNGEIPGLEIFEEHEPKATQN